MLLSIIYSMKKQTRFLSIFFGLIIFATILSGCQKINATVSLIENTFYTHTIYSQSNGKVTENIVINFDVFNRTATEINSVVNLAFQNCLIQKSLLEIKLSQQISESEQTEVTVENFAVATERKNNKIAFTIYYYTLEAWNFFNTFSGQINTPEIIERLFDYTRIDRKDMIGTVAFVDGEEQYFGNYLKSLIFDLIDNEDNTLISSQTVKSLYSYATSYSRRKSNAPYVASYEGLYFHIWDTTNVNVEFEFWYNLARVESWYILSLIIALSTVVTIFVVSHFKKEKNKVIIEDVNFASELKTEKNENEVVFNEEIKKIEEEKAPKKQKTSAKKIKEKTVKKSPKKRIKTKDE